ncbi:putative MFS family arabinose efflux permease [Dysgonomonas hofstadii]|uniref:Putative MFS family arabinose efflux permease n=1 Tax=Dysgonomonas hofstadii TaxID=637886 RepID=A0A840CQ33_9BACT|nr:MFS transporter [Dysgonomonas hofstadii]MBB4037161.1 putative MFS family arabinose efflux permease [Dysgonomonas hofstadii]
MLQPEKNNRQYLSKGTLWLMTIGAGLVVANNYYNQPLLGMISRELGESEAATSKVAMFTQVGYAAGLLLIIPLGDMFKRKQIVLIDFIFIIASLLVFAFSRSLPVMVTASFFIGLTSVVPQIFVPIAAQLSRPEEKERNVGIVMSGLLVGILASRVFSGIVGEYLGWREVFYIATAMMIVLAALIAWLLPDMRPTFGGTYGQLMASIARYTKELPSLRLASLRGALGFGSFSIFWTTLTFRLEQAPFFQGSDIAGSLGLVGIAGALAASLTGYIAGKINKNTIITIACILLILSWGIFGIGGSTYTGLIAGIIFLDLGLQAMHVTNQTIVFSTHPEASNRLNTVYMVSYFIGGSVGTLIGGQAWQYYGWTGVVSVGALFVILCLFVHLLLCNKPKFKE